jgi:hypothetical protein
MSDDTIPFGTADSWSYNRITKTYDLTRDSSKKLTIATTQGYADTFFTIDPQKSALVIVDMQNFFLDPKCTVHPLGLKAVEPTIAAIKKCRETGIQVGALYFPSLSLQCVIYLGRSRLIILLTLLGNLVKLGSHQRRHCENARRRAPRIRQGAN